METNCKTRSYIGEKRAEAMDATHRVCELIGCTYEQHCNYQFAQYERLIERALKGYTKDVVDHVKQSPVMRGFFIKEWASRNIESYLPFAAEHMKYSQSYVTDDNKLCICWDYSPYVDFLREEYLYEHNVEVLLSSDSFLKRFKQALAIC